MGYVRPSYEDLKRRIAADLSALPNAISIPLSAAWAQAAHSQHGFLDWLHKQCSPLSCDIERLNDWAMLYGVEQLLAVPASGFVLASGTVGTVVLADSRLRASNGLDYYVTSATVLTGSPTPVAVKCLSYGAAGNLVSGQELVLIDPIAGCAGSMVVDGDGLTGGEDIEGLELWRARVVDEWSTITTTGGRLGKPDDYRVWAKNAHPSVTTAFIQPQLMGAGTVGIRPVCNGLPNRLPSPAVLTAIRNKFFVSAPATADWYLAAPVVQPVGLSVHLAPSVDNLLNRTAVVAAFKAVILAELEHEAVLTLAKIDAALLSVTDQYTRVAPSADVAAGTGNVLVFDGVVFL